MPSIRIKGKNMTRKDEVVTWISQLKHLDWEFNLVEEPTIFAEMNIFLQLSFVRACACRDGKKMEHLCRKWRVSPRMTKSEFVQMAFAAVMAAVEHEAREEFKYNNAAVFSPHFDVDVLEKAYNEKKWDMRVNSFDINE